MGGGLSRSTVGLRDGDFSSFSVARNEHEEVSRKDMSWSRGRKWLFDGLLKITPPMATFIARQTYSRLYGEQ